MNSDKFFLLFAFFYLNFKNIFPPTPRKLSTERMVLVNELYSKVYSLIKTPPKSTVADSIEPLHSHFLFATVFSSSVAVLMIPIAGCAVTILVATDTDAIAAATIITVYSTHEFIWLGLGNLCDWVV